MRVSIKLIENLSTAILLLYSIDWKRWGAETIQVNHLAIPN
jgi:hypothetical protein